MGNLVWKAKQFLRKIFPLAVVGLIVYGGYNMVRKGYFHNGVGPAFTRVLHQVPYFGSRFRHYSENSYSSYSAPRSRSYAYGGGHRRSHSHRSHRRHHARRRHHHRR